MAKDPPAVGDRIRQARHTRGMSLAALAARAAVGKGSLSEIENGARSPNLSTLHALADALGVPLSTLLAEQVGAEVRAPGLTGRLLSAATQGGRIVEVYELRIEPGEPYIAAPHDRDVVEHVYVTDGAVSVGPVGSEVALAAGESTTWSGRVKHAFCAVGGVEASAILIMSWVRETEA